MKARITIQKDNGPEVNMILKMPHNQDPRVYIDRWIKDNLGECNYYDFRILE